MTFFFFFSYFCEQNVKGIMMSEAYKELIISEDEIL